MAIEERVMVSRPEPDEDDILTLTRRRDFLKAHQFLGEMKGLREEWRLVRERLDAEIRSIDQSINDLANRIDEAFPAPTYEEPIQ